MRLPPSLLYRLRDASRPIVAVVAAGFLGAQFLRGEALAPGFGWVLLLFFGMTLGFVALAGWATDRE
ncbi:hypothetical protein [Halorubrum lipolyticum]|uniref:Uncharacterized protein n=1 Tax=Halorubrum lipolyticum DSM 21995 TaxID=1227482 RepID=M0NNS8_9EURY|nr:hypothetical protein [Halorubrum lipolyticum]EMA58305.1 hypothetical protein C469_13885 [Halorubrum lipolyticum DSM 21995]